MSNWIALLVILVQLEIVDMLIRSSLMIHTQCSVSRKEVVLGQKVLLDKATDRKLCSRLLLLPCRTGNDVTFGGQLKGGNHTGFSSLLMLFGEGNIKVKAN